MSNPLVARAFEHLDELSDTLASLRRQLNERDAEPGILTNEKDYNKAPQVLQKLADAYKSAHRAHQIIERRIEEAERVSSSTANTIVSTLKR